MNKFVMIQIAGMIVVAIGGQGIIRLLLDHTHSGLLNWLPGGFFAWLGGYALLVLIGVLVAGWADTRSKKTA